MLVYAGIDEAGYGPMLGPLCVACSVFIVREHDPAEGAPDLWRILRAAVGRAGEDRSGRIAVDDSKKLKGANSGASHPLKRLERGVLAFLGAGGDHPETDDDLYRLLGVNVPSHGWYRQPSPLPLAHDADMLRIDAARLGRHLQEAGVEFAGLSCEAIDAGEFNQGVERMGTKAAINLGAALRCVDRIRRQYPQANPRILIDRHGGRVHYLRDLQIAFPEAMLTIVAETETLSRYRVVQGRRQLTVSFCPEAETRHLPVALASMAAKYVRELLMLRLNRFFRDRMPELKPTAGYVQDARRFLREVEPVMKSMRIDPGVLVRRR